MAALSGAAAAGTGATKSQLAEVVRAIRKCPIIDNHAHPLLKPEALNKHPLISITTEAAGDAIHATHTSLAHIRGVKQLAHVLDCGHTWEAVVAAIEQRRIEDYEDWVSECLDGIETILVDDGLDAVDDVQDYAWHDQFTRSPCKRIVRIETVAGKLIHKHATSKLSAALSPEALFDKVFDEFDSVMQEAIADPDVVGFKSVICYRTGLDIPSVPNVALAKAAFNELIKNYTAETADPSGVVRLQHPGINDLIVHHTAALISEIPNRNKKPIQFHTGLGDSDITLTKASPSHLQVFIRAYPTVPIVLLHASYPFTRELGYLATVYANVYADIGEIFPFISRDGQEKAVRQVLELCPWSKILWSTDGHWFPETYILAIIQIREVLESVLCEYVRRGAIGWKGAIHLARDILFSNSNKLYHLGISFAEWETDSEDKIEAEMEETDLEIFSRFLRGKQAPDFVRISWIDLTATPRMRMIPFRKMITSLEEGQRTDIGITKASLGLLQNDWMAPGFSPSGEYRLHPDFSSLKAGPIQGHLSMYGEFREEDGSTVSLCPRTQLQRAQEFGARQGLTFLVGFEIEFLLLQPVQGLDGSSIYYAALSSHGHSWSTSRFYADSKIPKLLADMVKTLESMDIFIEQVHAESAPGQFELVLPPLPPLAAVDTLLHTREVIAGLAVAAGYKFSLHPKPFAQTCGTASHVHLSITSTGGDRKAVYEPFYAGILKHLPAITAFTYSNPASYERVVDGAWAGGRWVTWGTQNRETPLRKIQGSHWELKSLDGLANPYLAVTVVLYAGICGIRCKERLAWVDCEVDPAHLTENDRKELNVTTMLPANLGEALEALKLDEELIDYLDDELLEGYYAVKEFELKLLNGMSPDQRRRWLLARY